MKHGTEKYSVILTSVRLLLYCRTSILPYFSHINLFMTKFALDYKVEKRSFLFRMGQKYGFFLKSKNKSTF